LAAGGSTSPAAPDNPDAAWTTQQAREFAWSLPERPRPIRFLIHHRDSKFTAAFDEGFP
jgi:putative transposase